MKYKIQLWFAIIKEEIIEASSEEEVYSKIDSKYSTDNKIDLHDVIICDSEIQDVEKV